MEFEGKIWKSQTHWLIEVPSLNMMTQGYTKEEAKEMLKGAILEYFQYYFDDDEDFGLTVNTYTKGIIGVSASNPKLLLALSLRRQREKSGSTVRDAAERLGSNSPNAYAQYEKGKTRISLDQYDKLLHAANPVNRIILRVVEIGVKMGKMYKMLKEGLKDIIEHQKGKKRLKTRVKHAIDYVKEDVKKKPDYDL